MVDKIVTPEFRLSYPNLFTPKEGKKPGDRPKFELNMLFPKTADLSLLKAAAEAAVKEKYGDKKPMLRNPFRDGDEAPYDGYAGHIYVRAWAYDRPGLVDQSVQPIVEQSVLYAGCYCRAAIRAFVYENPENKGISFWLMHVQKLRDGAPFGANNGKPEDMFDVVAKEVQAAGGKAATDDFWK